MKLGTYRHYKGKYYEVVGVGKHSETLEEYVVYFCLYPNASGQLWVRPKEMFEGKVHAGRRLVQRYTYIRNRKQLP